MIENMNLKTLDDVLNTYFKEGEDVSNGVWKVKYTAETGATDVFHYEKHECSIKALEDGYVVIRRTQLSSIPAMTARAMKKLGKEAKLLDYEEPFETPLDKAKYLINSFCEAEYGCEADFSDLQNIGIAFTTLTDDELPIQVTVNLVEYKTTYELDGELFLTETYNSLEEMIENQLECLNFDELVNCVPDEVLERHAA